MWICPVVQQKELKNNGNYEIYLNVLCGRKELDKEMRQLVLLSRLNTTLLGFFLQAKQGVYNAHYLY